jgi:hypothetical protein
VRGKRERVNEGYTKAEGGKRGREKRGLHKSSVKRELWVNKVVSQLTSSEPKNA